LTWVLDGNIPRINHPWDDGSSQKCLLGGTPDSGENAIYLYTGSETKRRKKRLIIGPGEDDEPWIGLSLIPIPINVFSGPQRPIN
jgi:hypothetical protein